MPAQWKVITAGEIMKSVHGDLLAGGERITFSGLSTDSRGISGGQLFWPLKGEKHDGHCFISQALKKHNDIVSPTSGVEKKTAPLGKA